MSRLRGGEGGRGARPLLLLCPGEDGWVLSFCLPVCVCACGRWFISMCRRIYQEQKKRSLAVAGSPQGRHRLLLLAFLPLPVCPYARVFWGAWCAVRCVEDDGASPNEEHDDDDNGPPHLCPSWISVNHTGNVIKNT